MRGPSTADETISIADHGMMGDLRTAALVATDGTIDWFCTPRFDSPSVLASLLHQESGGAWRLGPGPVDGQARSHHYYFPDTNILIIRFLTEQGVAEVHDSCRSSGPTTPSTGSAWSAGWSGSAAT